MQVCRLQTLERAAVLAFAIVMVCATAASANEVQLAGIRLGQHALHLMQVYGQPDGIVKGGAAQAQTPTAGQGAMGAQAGEMAGAAGAPGMAGGGPGGMPGGAPGGMPGGMPGMAGGMAGGMPGGMGAGMGAEAGMGAGAPGAAAGGAAAGQTGGSAAPRGGSVGGPPPGPFSFFSGNIPNWALPVWVPMISGESLWVYRKGAVVMGFVLDRDGYVLAIAVAGEKCDWARTAMWAPKRSVKLGDTFQTVISRYGYPESTAGYRPTEVSWLSSGGTAGSGGIQNAYRDVTLHYGSGENVEFLLRNMKVVRIHIWEPEARPPAMRATTAAAGGAGGGGMMGPMGAEGAAGPAG